MADLVASLRGEIVESIKIRADFLKWKILLIAALGAAALGLSKDANATPALLGFIPLVCAYVDVLCIHTDLRIFVIAKFLREHDRDASSSVYEVVVETHRSALVLESLALIWTTVVVSGFILAVALLPDHVLADAGSALVMHRAAKVFLVAMSVIGLLGSIVATVFKWYMTEHCLKAPTLASASKQAR